MLSRRMRPSTSPGPRRQPDPRRHGEAARRPLRGGVGSGPLGAVRPRRGLLLLAGLLAVTLVAGPGSRPAHAELVLLTDGQVFKVEAFAMDGEQAQLTLPGGGVIGLPALRIDRVLADEIVPEPEVVPEPAPAAGGMVSLRLDPQRHDMPIVPYGELIWAAAERHRVNPDLIAAVVRAESAFNRTAVSYKGARGLMQLMPATADRFGVRRDELFDAERNIEAGVRYLSWLIDRFPDQPEHVLAAYNAGENAVSRYGGVPPYRETKGYVTKIMGWLAADTPAVVANVQAGR
jgi:hypothetical protein